MELKLNVYDVAGKNIEKTYSAESYELMFGTVEALLDVLKIDQLDDTAELLKTVYSAWSEVRVVLSGVFPDVSADEWKRVKVKELLPIIVSVAKSAVADMLKIPAERKN